MTITVNGEARDVREGTTLAELIESLGLARRACAAEVNRTLVPRSEHPDRRLVPGDSVELMTLVGGG